MIKMYTINLNTINNITKQRGITNNPTKEMKWNH